MEKFLAGGFLMLLPLAAVLGFVSLRDGSFLWRATPTVMIFRRRRSMRALMLIMAFLMAVVAPLFARSNLISQLAQPDSVLPTDQRAAAVASAQFTTIFGVAGGMVVLCFCLPEELRLDVKKHTYHLIKGLWPLSMTRAGAWNDICGIYVWRVHGGFYAVCLAWQSPPKRWTLLGLAGRWERAEQLAYDLSHRTGLTLIEKPW